MPEVRTLPEWSKEVKKWMGEQGAMSNLQRDFVFFIEDSIIQPLRKKALEERSNRTESEKKTNEYKMVVDSLAERNGKLIAELDRLKQQLSFKENLLNQLTKTEGNVITETTTI